MNCEIYIHLSIKSLFSDRNFRANQEIVVHTDFKLYINQVVIMHIAHFQNSQSSKLNLKLINIYIIYMSYPVLQLLNIYMHLRDGKRKEAC